MTSEISIVLVILFISIILFIKECDCVDVVALMVRLALALTGLVAPAKTLSSFANHAVTVLLAPIGLNTAGDLGISPYPLMRTVTISASAAFLSSVGYSANILVMDLGGYRFSDQTKVGIPLKH